MAPIKGFGCGRFAVTQHCGLLNDGANVSKYPTGAVKNDQTIVDNRARPQWERVIAAFPVTH
jgi:hypothetical protein